MRRDLRNRESWDVCNSTVESSKPRWGTRLRSCEIEVVWTQRTSPRELVEVGVRRESEDRGSKERVYLYIEKSETLIRRYGCGHIGEGHVDQEHSQER